MKLEINFGKDGTIPNTWVLTAEEKEKFIEELRTEPDFKEVPLPEKPVFSNRLFRPTNRSNVCEFEDGQGESITIHPTNSPDRFIIAYSQGCAAVTRDNLDTSRLRRATVRDF